MLAIIIKGNPKFIHTEIAKNYYKEIEEFLKKLGFKVEFDAGADYTRPRQDADLYIGHSRGAGRYQFMTPANKPKFIKFGDPDGIIAADDREWQKNNPPPTNKTPPDSHFEFSKVQKAAILHKMKTLGLKPAGVSTESKLEGLTPSQQRIIDMALKDPHLGPAAIAKDASEIKWIIWNDEPIGFYAPKLEPDGRWRTGTIFIEPAYRGKRHAAFEVEAFFENGAKPGRAWIEPTNKPSQNLYKRAGFYKSGRIVNSKTTSRMFEEWINKPMPPLVSRPTLGW